jgi:selenocysteine lyase/cysteine desulfurase
LAAEWFNVRVRRIAPRRFVVEADELAAAITPRTRLVCVPWAIALEHLLDVGIEPIMRHDLALAGRLADGLRAAGLTLTGQHGSALVFFTHPDRAANERIHATLTDAGIDIAFRAGSLRVSAHLYNTSEDIDRLLTVVDGAFARRGS